MGPVQKAAEAPSPTVEIGAKPGAPPVFPSRYILGMRVDCTSYETAVEAILAMAYERRGGRVCISNVHMVMEAFDDPQFRHIVNTSDMVTSDGMPLVWTLRALGLPQARRVYGPTLMPHTCQRAAELGLKIGLYGGSQETLSDMRANLCRDYPGLQIAFAHSPPYRPLTAEEDDEIVRAIADAGVDILFVGLGCPKQERWMLAHASQLTCPAVGAGAAFDFIAGTKSQAPLWLQNSGFEWLYRLVCEPRRLWRRYLYNNPRFIVWLALQLMREHRSARAIEEAEPSSSRTRAYAKEPIDEQ